MSLIIQTQAPELLTLTSFRFDHTSAPPFHRISPSYHFALSFTAMAQQFHFHPTLPPPQFSRPKYLTTYPSHPPRHYNPHIPPHAQDLNVGYESHIPKRISPCLSPLLSAVQNIKFTNIKFVAYRGILAKLMRTPYEREAYTLRVTKQRGVVYIQEDLENKKEEPTNERMKRMSYWGYKFEVMYSTLILLSVCSDEG